MAKRVGKSIIYDKKIVITHYAAQVGKTEGEGPLKDEFDKIYEDSYLGESSWELGESKLLENTVNCLLAKAKMVIKDIDCIFSGDLLSQCISSSFAFRDKCVPVVGLYGACSTMALSLINGCNFLEAGSGSNAVCATVSHFCSSERQFRFPLQYGSIRTPTSQRTVTGSGASLLKCDCDGIKIYASKIGEIVDFGIKDSNNMGASMAPAACRTICEFMSDLNMEPSDFDCIVTGDLGIVGSELLCELAQKEYSVDISSVHRDCGKMIYYIKEQDVHSGGSGCGCSASVLNSYFLKRLENGELKRIMFVATGALLSPTTVKQQQTIPCIAHAVILEGLK